MSDFEYCSNWLQLESNLPFGRKPIINGGAIRPGGLLWYIVMLCKKANPDEKGLYSHGDWNRYNAQECHTWGILNSFSRLATWIEVTLDGAPITPAIISGSLPSLHASVVPAIFVTEPVVEEKSMCVQYIWCKMFICFPVYIIHLSENIPNQDSSATRTTHFTQGRLNTNMHWRYCLYVR